MEGADYRNHKVNYEPVLDQYDYSAVPMSNVYAQEPLYVVNVQSYPEQINYQDVPRGRDPVHMICPVCKNKIFTRVTHERGATAWIICLILCIFCFPFCIYPLVCEPCLDTLHTCPHCESELAVNKP